MAKLIGRTTFRCTYGCCRTSGHKRINRTAEKRSYRKKEKASWKRDVWKMEGVAV